MNVRAIMTPHPHTLAADASLGDAVELMAGYGIRHLPIVEDGDVVGIVSERDVKMALGPDAMHLDLEAIDPRQADGSVSWFMTEGVLTIEADAPVSEACERLLATKVGALAVTDGGALVGILSVLDVIRASLPLWAK